MDPESHAAPPLQDERAVVESPTTTQPPPNPHTITSGTSQEHANPSEEDREHHEHYHHHHRDRASYDFTFLRVPSPVSLQRIAEAQDARHAAYTFQRRAEREQQLAQLTRHETKRQTAATVIQRNYRGYRARRELQGMGLDPTTRWIEAIKDAKYRQATMPLSRQQRASASRDGAAADGRRDSSEQALNTWKRAATIARHAGSDNTSDESTLSDSDTHMGDHERLEWRKKRAERKQERDKWAKMMDLQYFLEMVDQKHRYGSHLRTYHAEWKKADTNENFFYWLDYGEGANIELPTVSREVLERDQVRYLSKEERQHYLVKVDEEGRLCWAKNGQRITTSIDFRDSVEGIVPVDSDAPTYRDAQGGGGTESREKQDEVFSDSASSSSSSVSIGAGSIQEDEAQHYTNHDLKKAKGLKKIRHISTAALMNHLLRKSVKKNTWIFVADTSFRLYVGIKQSGAFQHSSFLQGQRLLDAGLIKVKDGRLERLSPLSGHYRPPTSNFRAFVKAMKEEGVDMSHVSISRSYTILIGLEAYVRTRKKIKHGIGHVVEQKDKVLHPEEVARREEEKRDKSAAAQREREVLEREAQEEQRLKREQSLHVRVAQKLKLTDPDEKSPKSPMSSPSGAGKSPLRTAAAADGETGSSPIIEAKSPSKSPAKDTPPLAAAIKAAAAQAPKTAEGEDAESGIPPEGKR